jgi:UDP-3-O-acyl N-acetylglucosamine deacetylase
LPLKAEPLDRFIRQQSTISQPATVSGFGFWSGQDITIDFRPSAENTGIVFVRTDLPGNPRISAAIQNRVPGPRRTTLVHNGCAVEMVEHVLAALAGLQIDNCELHVNRAEMPGMDGSSQQFVAALLAAGRKSLAVPKPTLTVLEPVRVEQGDAWILAEPVVNCECKMTYQLEYAGEPAIGSQTFSTTLDTQTFVNQIASARTFLLQSEAEQLQRQGLGDRVSYQDVLVFDKSGPLENNLRFPDECARHKMLDMIGDFALSGKDLIGSFTASKSGHLLNSQMIFALLQQRICSQSNRQSA